MTTETDKPADWPLGEFQIKTTITYESEADLIAKQKYLADEMAADLGKILAVHPPWVKFKLNCCGGSPP